MIFSLNPARGSRILNGLALLGVTGALGVDFFWQFAYGELPCPLCLLQRVALVMAGVGFLLNLRMGPSPMHYAMSIAGALGGMLASGRQVLLHIMPGDPRYGEPFMGLHFYTWAFIENKNVFGLTVNLQVFNLTNGRGLVKRTIYDGPRNSSPILYIEHRNQLVGPIVQFNVKGAF